MPDRRRTGSLAAALLCIAVFAGPAFAASSSPPPAASGASLLRAAIGADDRISYEGTITTLVYGPHGAGATVVRVDHSAPTKWRMWFVAPADAYGRLIVSNESLTYQYEPKTATVFSNTWAQSSPGVTLDLDVGKVLRNYAILEGPTADVAGRAATELSLVSKYSGSLVERLWLDDQTKLVLRRETYLADGTIEEKTSFDNVRIVSDLPKNLFDLSVPSGMQVKQGTSYATSGQTVESVQSHVRFTIASPQYLPEGFSLEKTSLADQNGIQTAQLLYTDGLRDFSVFENASNQLPQFDDATRIDVGNTSGFSASLAGETLLTWNDGGLNITMVGDFTPKELARIGASIAP